MPPPPPRVAVLGAGPIGLEAALAAGERGWPTVVYESAAAVAANVRRWAHVGLFTPWDMNVSPRMRAGLGTTAPHGLGLPTGGELIQRVYEPLAALAPVANALRLGWRVRAVGREGLLKHERIGDPDRARRPFRLLVRDPGGDEHVHHADVVLDCTGTYGHPNALGDAGIPAPGEEALSAHIIRHLPDLVGEARAWAGRTVLLTGAGHSAQTAAVALAQLAAHAPGTRVIWAVRASHPDWYGVSDDPLPARARLTRSSRELAAGASAAVQVRLGRVTDSLAPAGGRIEVTLRNGQPERLEVDRILALNGGVGDHSIYRQLQVHECYATAGPMKLAATLLGESGGDCLAQAGHGPDVLTNPEPDFFMLGAKSYGRNSQFLLRIGWEQVDDVFGLLDTQRAVPR